MRQAGSSTCWRCVLWLWGPLAGAACSYYHHHAPEHAAPASAGSAGSALAGAACSYCVACSYCCVSKCYASTDKSWLTSASPSPARSWLAEMDLHLSPDTLRRWLMVEGLWHRRRQREPHRSRRPASTELLRRTGADGRLHP